MTLDEIVATLPDDAPVPAVVVRDYLRALREQHEREIDDAVRRTWVLRDSPTRDTIPARRSTSARAAAPSAGGTLPVPEHT